MSTKNTPTTRVHRAPCANGDICGEVAHCPPADTPPAEDAHPAPAAAPVAVPEGGWRDGDAVVTVNAARLIAWNRIDDRWFSGIVPAVDDEQIDAWRETVAYVHAPRENARPEPVVAPLPSEAVEAALERAIYNGAEAVDPDEHAEIMRAVMDVVTPHLRLVPEDDEDTVRVPRPVAQYAAAYIGEADHQEALDVAAAIESALGGAR